MPIIGRLKASWYNIFRQPDVTWLIHNAVDSPAWIRPFASFGSINKKGALDGRPFQKESNPGYLQEPGRNLPIVAGVPGTQVNVPTCVGIFATVKAVPVALRGVRMIVCPAAPPRSG